MANISNVSANFNLEHLTEIRKDNKALKQLELPPNYENIINGLVTSHFNKRQGSNSSNENYSFDPVKGKGHGLILLLHGAPGVGKTSTAGE